MKMLFNYVTGRDKFDIDVFMILYTITRGHIKKLKVKS